MTTATMQRPGTRRPDINTPPKRSPQTDANDPPANDLPQNASYWQIIKQAVSEWSEDKVPKLSASLAYFAMLALAPLIVITLKILSVPLGAKAASGQLQGQVSALAGPQVAKGIQATMEAANKPGSGIVATIISIVIAIWGAASLFGELQDSFNTIWEVKPKPDQGVMAWIKNRFFSMTMVMGVAFMLLVSMFVSTIITGISGWFIGHIFGTDGTASKAIAFVIDFVVSTGIITVLFATMFKYLPDVKIEWRDVWVGGFVTAVLFQIGKYVLGFYLGKAAPGSAYGAAGSLVALLIWVYYSGFILYFGAEFTQVYARKGGRVVHPSENAVEMTDEDRMEMGMPHTGAVEHAADRQHPGARNDRQSGFSPTGSPSKTTAPGKRRLPSYVCDFDQTEGSRKNWLYGAGGLLLGAIAGGVSTYFAERGMLPGTTPKPLLRNPNRKDLTQVNLQNRLERIEAAAGDVESFEHKLRAKRLADEVEQMSHRIRQAELRLETPVPQTFAGRMAGLYREAKRHVIER